MGWNNLSAEWFYLNNMILKDHVICSIGFLTLLEGQWISNYRFKSDNTPPSRLSILAHQLALTHSGADFTI